jgi:hypothetical protein
VEDIVLEDVVAARRLVEGIEAVEQRCHAVATGRLVEDSMIQDNVGAEGRLVEDGMIEDIAEAEGLGDGIQAVEVEQR